MAAIVFDFQESSYGSIEAFVVKRPKVTWIIGYVVTVFCTAMEINDAH